MRVVETDDSRCTNGWGPGGCTYTGGCYCERLAGHAGRCRCTCGSNTTKKPVE